MSHPVVVIGAGLGGLSAAIHLRMRGFDVIVLEKNSQPGGRANRIDDRGYLFDTAVADQLSVGVRTALCCKWCNDG